MEDITQEVKSLIKKWKVPTDLNSEGKIRDNLIDFLRAKLLVLYDEGDINQRPKINKEVGRSLADIGINDGKIGVEMKHNVTKTSEVDRLYGQIKRHWKDYDYLIIVLTGRTKEERYEEIVNNLREFRNSNDIDVDNLFLISKDNHEKKKDDDDDNMCFNI